MNHEEFKSNDAAILALVRAVAPPDASAATYAVLIAAARQAVDMTSVRADGQVHHDDALAILRCALGGIPRLRAEDIRTVAREAAYAEICKLLGCGAGMDPDTHGAKACDAIADRVAEQLTGRAVKP